MNKATSPTCIEADTWAAFGAKPDGSGFVYRDHTGTPLDGGTPGLAMTMSTAMGMHGHSAAPLYIVPDVKDACILYQFGYHSITGPAPLLAMFCKAKWVVIVADSEAVARVLYAELLATVEGAAFITAPDGGIYVSTHRGVLNDEGFHRLAKNKAVPMKLPKAAAQTGGERCGSPVLRRLSDVKSERVEWLWHERIAIGKLTILSGDPCLGKSFVTLDIAARVSTARAFPLDGTDQRPPGGVVLLNAEDDAADTVKPRLEALGADCARILTLDAVRKVNPATAKLGEKMFNLQGDLPALREAIEHVGDCRMVVIDPISAYLGTTESHDNGQVRGLLAPLSALASELRVAMVCVTHNNKGNGKAMHRVMGSLAFVAAARSAWGFFQDPQDEHRRLMLPLKNNIAPNTGGLAYSLRPVPGSAPGSPPMVVWEHEPVTITAEELSASALDTGGSARPKQTNAADFLRRELANGRRWATDIDRAAKAEGISDATLRRAADDLNIKKRKYQGHWYWELPAPKMLIQDAQPIDDEHLGRTPVPIPVTTTLADDSKMLITQGVSTEDEHLGGGGNDATGGDE